MFGVRPAIFRSGSCIRRQAARHPWSQKEPFDYARKITDLDQLTEHADVLLCDVWGVIHNGVNPFPLSVEALKACAGSVARLSF
jgi:5'-3' exonuclease